MPHNKLLPDAFNFQTKGKRDLDFNKKKQKNNKDLLENIDKKVIENQAKEVQKFLAPIHLVLLCIYRGRGLSKKINKFQKMEIL